MDIDWLIPYLLHLVVLHVSVAVGAIYLVYKYKSAAGKFPPGRKGLPYIGKTLSFASASRWGCPEKFIRDRSAKYSEDVFRTSLLGEEMAIFCGAAGNKFLFTSQDKYVTSWWPKGIVKPFTGDSNFNQDSNKLLLSNVLPILKPDSLKQYIPIMDLMAKEHLHKYWWSPNPKKYTFALACRLFMSVHDEQEVENLAKPFVLATAGLVSLPIDLPGTTFRRAIKAGTFIRQQLLALVTNKKNQLFANIQAAAQTQTLASDLVDSLLMEGLTEIEVVQTLVGLFIASYDTTSSVLTFTISYLCDYPEIYNRVLQEHMDVVRSKEVGASLRWEDIQKMRYTWCVVCEAMRLTPPAYGAFREAKTDFTFAGYTIPKGWKAMWTVHSTNKNPAYFPEPEKFDPSRFEGNGPAPYTFVPFGGGPRMCPGKEYARLEILTFIHNLVTKFKWNKLNPNEKISYLSSAIPEEGLPIKLQPITIN